MQYRKKPVVIEAFRLGYDKYPYWFDEAIKNKCIEVETVIGFISSTSIFRIKTLEGIMTARYGDYIIQGVQGELYPCKAEIFEKTHELAE